MLNNQIIKILNVNINNITLKKLLNDVTSGFIIPLNVDMIMKSQTDKEFHDLLQKENIIICDSQIIYLLSRVLNTPIIEKISGSDFFPIFCDYHKDNDDIKIFLLGSAKQEIVEKAKDNINERLKKNIIIDAFSPSFGFEAKEDENEQIINRINESGSTVLAVGVGAPKQEKWIMQHKDQLINIKIFMAIGATIDFEANNVTRAPKWMSDNGVEWLFRLMSEPKRLWKRYLIDDMPFFWLILKQKLGFYKAKWE